MTFDEWKSIIDKMIEAFKLMIIADESYNLISSKEMKNYSKNRRKKINYGLRLFIKYYNHLWY